MYLNMFTISLSHEQDMIQGQFFKRSLICLNSEFSFHNTSCHTKVNGLSLPNYLSNEEELLNTYLPQGY